MSALPEVDQLLQEILAEVSDRQFPESTYRWQFHSGFRFEQATALVPYLAELGITDCYSSPYLRARPGSQHGYDIVDHSQINPEIGSESDFTAFCTALKRHGLGQILDVVPNHMAVVGNENQWWNDILENGPSSPYAHFFDIAWSLSSRPELQGRVLVPILGEPYGRALESQQLQLRFEAGAFAVHYFEHRFPLTPRSYGQILRHGLSDLEQRMREDSAGLLEYRSILTSIEHLPPWHSSDPTHVAEVQREKEVIKKRLAALAQSEPVIAESIAATLHGFNGVVGQSESFDPLERLLDDQPYRLAYWRVASDEINYRRFFDVNELAALNMESADVFAATHRLILRFLETRAVTGLRIDHPDGLYDPLQYLNRLQSEAVMLRAKKIVERSGRDWDSVREPLGQLLADNPERCSLRTEAGAPRWSLFVVVEKILIGNEALPANWPTAGTTGYEFLQLSGGLFVDQSNAQSLTRAYHEWIGDTTRFSDCALAQKSLILQIALSSELQMLTQQLDRLAQKKRWSRDFTQHTLRSALRAVIASFPVYRTYLGPSEIGDADAKSVLRGVSRAMAHNPAISTSVFNFIRDTLLARDPNGGSPDPAYQAEQHHFAGKFQQLTSPVMAKGVEDTAFYVYNRLLALNEVGGSPDQFGLAPESVHDAFRRRRIKHPWGLSATSTHDTKRSEDVRSRLRVLSEMPDAWRDALARWSEMNQRHRIDVESAPAPDANEEWFLYQTLLGAWPIEPCDPAGYQAFVERIRSYMRKALQEAKVHTSWINPNSAYDEAIDRFVSAILDPNQSREFLSDLRTLQSRLSHLGMFNSLSETVVKLTAPGVADFYQGTEIWDFSLVDPDNRRPVDYERPRSMLAELKRRSGEPGVDLAKFGSELVDQKNDGRIKLYVIWRGLHLRRENPGLFTAGEYEAVEVTGDRAPHIFSFQRRSTSAAALTVVPRLLAKLIDERPPLGLEIWGDSSLRLPAGPVSWRNVFTNEVVSAREIGGGISLQVADALRNFPVAILVPESPRA